MKMKNLKIEIIREIGNGENNKTIYLIKVGKKKHIAYCNIKPICEVEE